MSWRTASIVVMLGYGLAMFLIAKANPIHGSKVACLMQGVGYLVLVTALGFGRGDIARITRGSLLLGIGAAVLLCGCTYLMFHAIAAHPDKAGIINIITEGWPLITALLIHFTMVPLTGRQWLCALVAMSGIAGLIASSPKS